jgi:hypothetical protein
MNAVEQKVNTFAEYLAKAREANPQSGEISLEGLEKKLGLSRHELVEQAKAAGKGTAFRVGRKAHGSSLLYGEAAREFLASKANRESHQKNRTPRKFKNLDPVRVAKGNEIKYNFRISVGNETETIPVKFALEQVA